MSANSTLSRKDVLLRHKVRCCNCHKCSPVCKNFKALKSLRNTKTTCISCLEGRSYVRNVTPHSVELINVIKNLAASARSAFLSKRFNTKKNFKVTSKNGIREKEHQRNGRLMQRNRGKLFIFNFFRMFKTTLQRFSS